MNFSESEIEKCKELKKLGFQKSWQPQVGQYLWSRQTPQGCKQISEQIHLIVDALPELQSELWLPRFDDLIEVCRSRMISFSKITDYMHRRRFADNNEREGLYQLLIDEMRSFSK